MPRPNDPELPSLLQQRFTNREDHLGSFVRHMESVTVPLPALMFYGMGGVGKSWLLRKLQLELRGVHAAPCVLIDYTREQGSNPYLGHHPDRFLQILARFLDGLALGVRAGQLFGKTSSPSSTSKGSGEPIL